MYRVYSTPTCIYCRAAKELLNRKGLEFEEIDLNKSEAGVAVMKELKARTVPQIFHNDTHIGGYTDLEAYLEN